MNRILPIIAACAMLGGCATVAGTMQKAPVVTFESAATPGNIVRCYSPWLMTGLNGAFSRSSVMPSQTGYIVNVTGSALNDPAAMVTIDKHGTGSTVAVRKGVAFNLMPKIVSALRVCGEKQA